MVIAIECYFCPFKSLSDDQPALVKLFQNVSIYLEKVCQLKTGSWGVQRHIICILLFPIAVFFPVTHILCPICLKQCQMHTLFDREN